MLMYSIKHILTASGNDKNDIPSDDVPLHVAFDDLDS
jgi:hypothetical protein